MSFKGFIKTLKEFGTEAEKRSYGKPEEELVTKGNRDDLIIRSLDDTEIKALNQSLKEDGYKGPGLNLGRIGEFLMKRTAEIKLV